MSATGSDAFGRCVYCGSLTDSVGCVNISCAARTGMRATEADSSVAIDCPDAGAEGARTVLRATPPPERNHATGCAFAGPVLGFQSCGCNAPAVGAGAEPVAPSSLIGACPVCQHALDQCSHCDVPAVGAEAEPVAWGIWNAKRGAVVQTWCGVGAERDARRVARIVSESAWGKCEPVPLYRAPRVPEVMEADRDDAVHCYAVLSLIHYRHRACLPDDHMRELVGSAMNASSRLNTLLTAALRGGK